MAPFIARLMRSARATPEKVAKRIVRVIRRKNPPLRVQVTRDAFWFAMLRRVLPQRFYHALLYRSLPGIAEWGPHDESGRRLTKPGATPTIDPFRTSGRPE